MSDIAVYFDNSGLAGTVGSTHLWADVVNWQRGLGADEYPELAHLVDNGWGQDLDALQAELEAALSDNPPPGGALEGGLHELLDIVGSRTDGDSAVAVALANAGGEDGDEVVGNDLSHRDIDQAIGQMLAEKYLKPSSGAGGNVPEVRLLDCWPVDIYDDYFVYRMTSPAGSKFYRQDYSVDENDQVSFDGEPEQVVKVTDYVPAGDAGAGSGPDTYNAELAANGKRLPSGRLGISPAKACQILKDGEVRGRPLTQAQRGLFGVICGRRGKKTAATNAELEEHECGCVGPCQCGSLDLTGAVREMADEEEEDSGGADPTHNAGGPRESLRQAAGGGAGAVLGEVRALLRAEGLRAAVGEITGGVGRQTTVC